LDRITAERSVLARDLGRIEGALNEAKKRSVAVARDPYVKIPREDLSALKEEVDAQVALVEGAEPGAIHAAIQSLRNAMAAFFERYAGPADDFMADEELMAKELEGKREDMVRKDAELTEETERARSELSHARERMMAHEETGREQNRRLLDLAESKAKVEAELARHSAHLGQLDYLAEDLEQNRREAVALVGVNALSYEAVSELPQEERRVQEDRKRSMERLKIRVEEAGGSGEDVRSEYKEATEREAFLATELEDLATSAAGLRSLIAELDAELQKSFAEGLAKVNASFGEFFGLMFGGGGARLVLEEVSQPGAEDEEDEYEEVKRKPNQKPGIEISVHLPKKRVQSLMQLSGGERALTSIALIFAMSQVNPPPFLILDETDAALDEANSRRYGDMIESLSHKSQLIVITHNRETMSRASILYGVTMGADGISKLLSVKFEEAQAVAK
ncbi:AAA family ATPase, partial [Patescibacteria group bacterium]|nr:AAA family ATPase [Patescibacteria group bacterium]